MLSCRETRDESCEAAYLNGFGAKCRILSSPCFSVQNTLGYVVRKGFKRTCGAANHCAQPKHANHASRVLRTSGSTTMEKVRETSCRVCPYDSSCISKRLPQASSKTNQPQEGERAKAEHAARQQADYSQPPTTTSADNPVSNANM